MRRDLFLEIRVTEADIVIGHLAELDKTFKFVLPVLAKFYRRWRIVHVQQNNGLFHLWPAMFILIQRSHFFYTITAKKYTVLQGHGENNILK